VTRSVEVGVIFEVFMVVKIYMAVFWLIDCVVLTGCPDDGGSRFVQMLVTTCRPMECHTPENNTGGKNHINLKSG
jgi:hypothetical protein